ncbi:MAG: hypothetical protein HKO62_07875 [Gammaproteobacteria bacterium]|nr:hypothetical protein [Gammaproteobacteria bacterium]
MNKPEEQALRHVAVAETMTREIPGISPDTAPRPVDRVGVIGAGTMGGGIAMNFANAGIPVTLVETSEAALQRGLGIIQSNYARTVKKEKISQAQMDERLALIDGALDYAPLAGADLVIEAVFENMDIKRQVFKALDEVCKPGAILATNTSTLDVDAIAAVTGRPEDVIGLHFFSPANVMRLLEIVRGAATADEVIVTGLAVAERIGKVSAVVGVCFGFVGNRMLEPYSREAQMLLLEGATPAQVDKALTDFGMAMGPCAVHDLAGIDVSFKVRQERDDVPDDPRYGWAIVELYNADRYGQKNGKGFYRYEAGNRQPIADPDVDAMIAAAAKRLGVERRAISDEEIVARCLFPLINEGALCLEEGIAIRPGDIDVIWINGYGFPAQRGGPMYYADSVGLEEIFRFIGDYHVSHGAQFWTPAPLLEQLLLEGRNFSDLNNYPEESA